jgi:hypothetical protein
MADATRVLPFDTIAVQSPPCCTYVNRISGFISSGENALLLEPVDLKDGFTSRLVRVIEAGNPSGMLEVQFYLCVDQEGLNGILPTPLRPTVNRTYISYPPEVVLSNYVKTISSSSVDMEAYVFRRGTIDDGNAANSVGMSNAFTLRYTFTLDCMTQVRNVGDDYLTFPFHDNYSLRRWELVDRIAKTLTDGLCHMSLAQRLSKSIRMPASVDEWAYLLRRFGDTIHPIVRNGVSTVRINRLWASREAIKYPAPKEVVRPRPTSLY